MDSDEVLKGIIRYTLKDGELMRSTFGEYVFFEYVKDRIQNYDYDIKSKIKEFIDGL